MINSKAQGSLEYLLMIGAAILVVAIVIVGISGVITQTKDENSNKNYDDQMSKLDDLKRNGFDYDNTKEDVIQEDIDYSVSFASGEGSIPQLDLGSNWTIALTLKEVTNLPTLILNDSDISRVGLDLYGRVETSLNYTSKYCNTEGGYWNGVNRLVISKSAADPEFNAYKNGILISKGANNNMSGVSFSGFINTLGGTKIVDEFIITSDAKNQAWATADYNGGNIKRYTSSEPNLVHGWHFDEGAGNIAHDFKGNSDITLSGNYNWVSNSVSNNTNSSEKQILDFNLTDSIFTTSIDQTNHTVLIIWDEGTDLAYSIPSILVSPGASIYPASGDMVNLTNPLNYTVTAEDGSPQVYVVSAVPKWSAVFDEKNYGEALAICNNWGGRLPGVGEVCGKILSLPAKNFWTSETYNGQMYTVQRSATLGYCTQILNPGNILNAVVCVK